jgi:alkanesulfonate monooxygenase SsuD/methylene tetrahydromethanopterin reductase-like flavin-dependent oxidoreductase (luciferase family)
MIPLSVLDPVPISSGSTAAKALRNSVNLARACEYFGYRRYWFAEHHLNLGVAGTSPAVLLALTAAATSRIRIGSGAVEMSHRTPLSTVEEFGLIDAMHPGRVDLGLSRSDGEPQGEPVLAGSFRIARATRAPNGLLIPPPPSPWQLPGSPRLAKKELLGGRPQDHTSQVKDVLALLNGTHQGGHAMPGEGANVQVWILGSDGGESAQVAGANGLRFSASYHLSPGTVLEAADGYRAAFQPSTGLDHPYVSVCADVMVAPTEAEARELAAGYGLWVRGIRTGEGAIPYPTPGESRARRWSAEDTELVADLVDTQFVGNPGQVANRLEQLRDATGADELIITTIAHDHADRVRSYQLLAEEWRRRCA